MKFLRTLLSLSILGIAAQTAFGSDKSVTPEKELKDLVAREKQLTAQAAKAGPNFDEDDFRNQMQQLADAYEKLIRQAPEFVPTYVAYGLMLDKIGMRKESIVLLLRANHIDQNIAVVKNQLGRYMAEEGKPLEAMAFFITAVELEPKEPLYHYQMATLLAEARDDFLKSGQWTRQQLDKNMLEGFHKAAELAPDNIGYAYRAAEAYGDLGEPRWDDAMTAWHALEGRAKPGVEVQTIHLQEANILLKQQKINEARELLATVDEPVLAKNKQTLVDQLPKNTEK